MIRKSAHKDMKNPPGQYIPKTLGEIIDRVQRQDRNDRNKLTFDEWWDKEGKFLSILSYSQAKYVWNMGQQNV